MANHIPAYLVGGEFDIFQRGEPINYAELQNAWDHRSATAPMRPGQRTTGRYQLIDGPWEHLNGSSVNVDPLELEWFDTWLKHERTGMARTRTPLHYYDLGSGRFDETTTYPFTGATPTRLYLGAGGRSHGARRALGAHGLAPPLSAWRDVRRRPSAPSDERHDRLEPQRRCLRTSDRPVVDGRHLDPRRHSPDCWLRAPTTISSPRPARGRSATPRRRSPTPRPSPDRSPRPCTPARPPRDRARRRARGRDAERRLVPADRGRAARIAAGGRSQPLLDGRAA